MAHASRRAGRSGVCRHCRRCSRPVPASLIFFADGLRALRRADEVEWVKDHLRGATGKLGFNAARTLLSNMGTHDAGFPVYDDTI